MKVKMLSPLKRLFINVIAISLLTSISLAAIVLILKNPLSVTNAQATPTSFWNVERDASNNLNFSFTNNNTPGAIGLQLLSNGSLTSNGQIAAKRGFNTGTAGANSGMTGDHPYEWGYQEPGAWATPNTSSLILGYHTGVKLGGHPTYGGTKFYNEHPSRATAQLFSVGDGDNNVRVANDLVFPNVGQGVSSPHNTARLIPNTGTYGAWRSSGNRNGWGGIEFDMPYAPASSISLMMGHSTHANSNVYTGMHLNGVGWLWYASGKDLYTGTAGSTTAGSMFAESFRDLGNQGYYLDPAGASNLNGATFASGPYTNDWFRVNGNNGLYFQSYGGGWHMVDTTYLRSYGNKPILVPLMYDQDNAGYYVDPHNVSNVNQVNATTIYTPTTGSFFPHPNGWNYIRGNSYIAGDTGAILANGNVGIGTTAPQYRLSVGFGNGDLFNVYQPGDDALAIQTTLNAQPNNGYGGHAANRLVLQPTVGYVGIKTANPTADLHIKQSDQSQWGGGGIKLERSSSGYARIFMGDDQQLYFFTNSNSHYCLVSLSGSIPCASDGRLKKDIEPLSVSALDIISKLKPSTYTWKESGEHSAGFIAQDVETILPEAVTKSKETGYYALSDAYFTPYLVKSIQELDQKDKTKQIEIDELKKKLQEQTNVNNVQSSELSELKQELEILKNEIKELR